MVARRDLPILLDTKPFLRGCNTCATRSTRAPASSILASASARRHPHAHTCGRRFDHAFPVERCVCAPAWTCVRVAEWDREPPTCFFTRRRKVWTWKDSIRDEQAAPGLPIHCTGDVTASHHILGGEDLSRTNHATFAVADRHFHVGVQAHDQLSLGCVVPREVVVCRRSAEQQASFGRERIRKQTDGAFGFQWDLLQMSWICGQRTSCSPKRDPAILRNSKE